MQQTAPSLSEYRKQEAYYNHRHRGISGTNFSIQVSRQRDTYLMCLPIKNNYKKYYLNLTNP
jgi:hypothetical protein